jgi:hypothetical protein
LIVSDAHERGELEEFFSGSFAFDGVTALRACADGSATFA